jgi:hypothetical protein
MIWQDLLPDPSMHEPSENFDLWALDRLNLLELPSLFLAFVSLALVYATDVLPLTSQVAAPHAPPTALNHRHPPPPSTTALHHRPPPPPSTTALAPPQHRLALPLALAQPSAPSPSPRLVSAPAPHPLPPRLTHASTTDGWGRLCRPPSAPPPRALMGLALMLLWTATGFRAVALLPTLGPMVRMWQYMVKDVFQCAHLDLT